MREFALVCAFSEKRAAITSETDLPHGWIQVPSISIGTGPGSEPDTMTDLHFASLDALASWARSQEIRRRNMRAVQPAAGRVA